MSAFPSVWAPPPGVSVLTLPCAALTFLPRRTPRRRLADAGRRAAHPPPGPGGPAGRGRLAAALACAALAAIGALILGRPEAPSAAVAMASVPAPPAVAARSPVHIAPTGGYVSSDACKDCHLDEWQSWHRSHHRSMTQLATPQTVVPPWEGELSWRGRAHRLFRRGEQLWVRLPAPERSAAAPPPSSAAADTELPVVMTTGSHHYQAYWVAGARGNELLQLPFVYHLESGRFLPRHDVFLQPEDDPVHTARWNSNCIQCHSVAGEPRHDLASDRFESRVAELGVACEACHGPGRAHVDSRRREQVGAAGSATAAGAPAPPLDDIVQPARLDAERGSQVCGQCHSYFLPRDPDRWWQSGFVGSYRPGDDLNASRRLLSHERGASVEDPELSASLDSVFYPDGTIRVGGREYNGLASSACFTAGSGARRLACTSCHRMHGGTRDDQLEAADDGSAACQGCHGGYGDDHTRHAPGSSGSRCVSCHMPRTTYALFKAIRSHRITSPEVDRTPGARLNACNLCHQDRPLTWTERELAGWRSPAAEAAADPQGASNRPAQPAAEPASAVASGAEAAAPQELSALAVAALAGDAAARVIAVHALGAPAAERAGSGGWQTQVLAEALDDPYAAVRFVAARSLRSWPGFERFELDFVAPRAERLARREAARRRARALAAGTGSAARGALPMDASGRVRPEALEALLRRRDLRPVRIAE